MEPFSDNDMMNLRREAAGFALKHIATRQELSVSTVFPDDVWKAFGTDGLLGVAAPTEYGGRGLGYEGIYTAGRMLVRHGHCMGIALSWLMHQIVARFFLAGHASEAQKHKYLTAMAAGRITASIAISEPGVGGHPKHLKTRAEKDGPNYVITGEKTFLTNGPIAGLFIVLAVIGRDGSKKRYSAFLVPKETPRLRLAEGVDFGFLRPCPHGGIVLDDCVVPEEDLLGIPCMAYEQMAIPFRDIEDAMMMGPILGAQEARLCLIAAALREAESPVAEDVIFRLGGLDATLGALGVIASESSRMLDSHCDLTDLQRLILAFSCIGSRMHSDFDELASQPGIRLSDIYGLLTHDLDHVIRFAQNVRRLKQARLGAYVVHPENGAQEGE